MYTWLECGRCFVFCLFDILEEEEREGDERQIVAFVFSGNTLFFLFRLLFHLFILNHFERLD